ncbi:MAG: hypothetical protein HYU68_03985 [Bacteroidetes bacterium]|nr:hypothetical protein [Bacteroidota bacterium]
MGEFRYQLFPRSFGITEQVRATIDCFENNFQLIDSENFNYSSNDVLEIVRDDLEKIGFKIEKSKKQDDKIRVPVLFGLNNKIDKFFDADGISEDLSIVLEVEAGRAYRNNQFLKDIFQACMMPSVEYLILTVRNTYAGTDDFQSIFAFIETLYVNGRLKLPLKGIVLIGY